MDEAPEACSSSSPNINSVLKPPKPRLPLKDLMSAAHDEDNTAARKRRVSFANVNKIKEFSAGAESMVVCHTPAYEEPFSMSSDSSYPSGVDGCTPDKPNLIIDSKAVLYSEKENIEAEKLFYLENTLQNKFNPHNKASRNSTKFSMEMDLTSLMGNVTQTMMCSDQMDLTNITQMASVGGNSMKTIRYSSDKMDLTDLPLRVSVGGNSTKTIRYSSDRMDLTNLSQRTLYEQRMISNNRQSIGDTNLDDSGALELTEAINEPKITGSTSRYSLWKGEESCGNVLYSVNSTRYSMNGMDLTKAAISNQSSASRRKSSRYSIVNMDFTDAIDNVDLYNLESTEVTDEGTGLSTKFPMCDMELTGVIRRDLTRLSVDTMDCTDVAGDRLEYSADSETSMDFTKPIHNIFSSVCDKECTLSDSNITLVAKVDDENVEGDKGTCFSKDMEITTFNYNLKICDRSIDSTEENKPELKKFQEETGSSVNVHLQGNIAQPGLSISVANRVDGNNSSPNKESILNMSITESKGNTLDPVSLEYASKHPANTNNISQYKQNLDSSEKKPDVEFEPVNVSSHKSHLNTEDIKIKTTDDDLVPNTTSSSKPTDSIANVSISSTNISVCHKELKELSGNEDFNSVHEPVLSIGDKVENVSDAPKFKYNSRKSMGFPLVNVFKINDSVQEISMDVSTCDIGGDDSKRITTNSKDFSNQEMSVIEIEDSSVNEVDMSSFELDPKLSPKVNARNTGLESIDDIGNNTNSNKNFDAKNELEHSLSLQKSAPHLLIPLISSPNRNDESFLCKPSNELNIKNIIVSEHEQTKEMPTQLNKSVNQQDENCEKKLSHTFVKDVTLENSFNLPGGSSNGSLNDSICCRNVTLTRGVEKQNDTVTHENVDESAKEETRSLQTNVLESLPPIQRMSISDNIHFSDDHKNVRSADSITDKKEKGNKRSFELALEPENDIEESPSKQICILRNENFDEDIEILNNVTAPSLLMHTLTMPNDSVCGSQRHNVTSPHCRVMYHSPQGHTSLQVNHTIKSDHGEDTKESAQSSAGGKTPHYDLANSFSLRVDITTECNVSTNVTNHLENIDFNLKMQNKSISNYTDNQIEDESKALIHVEPPNIVVSVVANCSTGISPMGKSATEFDSLLSVSSNDLENSSEEICDNNEEFIKLNQTEPRIVTRDPYLKAKSMKSLPPNAHVFKKALLSPTIGHADEDMSPLCLIPKWIRVVFSRDANGSVNAAFELLCPEKERIVGEYILRQAKTALFLDGMSDLRSQLSSIDTASLAALVRCVSLICKYHNGHLKGNVLTIEVVNCPSGFWSFIEINLEYPQYLSETDINISEQRTGELKLSRVRHMFEKIPKGPNRLLDFAIALTKLQYE